MALQCHISGQTSVSLVSPNITDMCTDALEDPWKHEKNFSPFKPLWCMCSGSSWFEVAIFWWLMMLRTLFITYFYIYICDVSIQVSSPVFIHWFSLFLICSISLYNILQLEDLWQTCILQISMDWDSISYSVCWWTVMFNYDEAKLFSLSVSNTFIVCLVYLKNLPNWNF